MKTTEWDNYSSTKMNKADLLKAKKIITKLKKWFKNLEDIVELTKYRRVKQFLSKYSTKRNYQGSQVKECVIPTLPQGKYNKIFTGL